MKEEPSYKLGDIGEKYAKLGKIEYNGGLDKLFKEDKEKYVDYNIRDVEIIEALEEKQKFIELTVLISHLCHTPYESIYYNTTLNEGAILTYLKRKGIVAPNKPTTTNPSIKEIEIDDHVIHQRGTPTVEGILYEVKGDQAVIRTMSGHYINRNIRSIRKKDSYAGGYLLDPRPGLYSDVSDLDFTSLYPSIIKSLNEQREKGLTSYTDDEIKEAGIDAIAHKAAVGTQMMIELYDEWLAPLGIELNTSRDPKERGGHISLVHPDAAQICVALRTISNVIPDYRTPNSIRLAISPLPTSYVEVWDGFARMRDLVASGRYKEVQEGGSRVT
jgi:hypothetical protein